LQKTQSELENTNIKIEQALEKANEGNRIKTELLALMSHEIRTPLTGIIGFTELILNDLSEEQKNEKCIEHKTNLEIIKKSSLRLNELLTNLLEMSVIIAGNKVQIKYTVFDIKKLIDDIIQMFEKRIIDQKNKVFFDFKCEQYIYSDPLRIQQILFNLIGNALKFTTNGEVSIKVIKKESEYLFEISDTGIGIEKSHQELIFDAFQQIDSSLRRKYQGIGLGLTVCKKFVEALGGNIRVESEAGKGSSFFFTLPLSETSGIVSEPQKVKTETKTLQKKYKVLFAEDELANNNFIDKILNSIGCGEHRGFMNGKELLQHFEKNRNYDLIILDIQMPVMDGVECLTEIRKIDKNIPVIALTAYSMETDKEKFLDLGFKGYIGKPFTIQDLSKEIALLLEQ